MHRQQEFHNNNPLLEKTYMECMQPEQVGSILEKMNEVLPTSFRLNKTKKTVQTLKRLLKHEFCILREKGMLTEPIKWLYDEMGWKLNVKRGTLKKEPQYKLFHDRLVSLCAGGHVYRQEEVSMLPVELLDVQPEHSILDFCAAPGSKTFQILEQMHAKAQNAIPTGLLVANDVSQTRSNLLYHQVKPMASSVLVVTHNDATHYPTIFCPEKLLFDRILCDVPCSGDGTLRKNPRLWKTWVPALSFGLHVTQIGILERAVRLCKPGGRIVYSTCSLCPVENEAVVSCVLSRYKEYVELVDVSDTLPSLQRVNGLQTWKVVGKQGSVWKTFADAPTDEDLKESFFPSVEAKEQKLERCLRIYPQDQNTGGFFVAVLKRKQALFREKKKNLDKEQPERAVKRFSLLKNDLSEFYKFYGFPDNALPETQFVSGLEQGLQHKIVFLVSNKAWQFVSCAAKSSLTIKNAGVAVMKQNLKNGDCQFCYKLLSSSVNLLGVHMRHRTVVCSIQPCCRLLSEEVSIDSLEKTLQKQLETTTLGPFLVRCAETPDICFYIWRGKKQLTVCVPKEERAGLLYILSDKQTPENGIEA